MIRLKENKDIREHLSNMLDNYLISFDDFIYRRIAELLLSINYSDLQANLMKRCKESENEDLLEIYDDFIEKYK